MLRSMKSSGPENDKSAAEISAVQPHDHAVVTKPGTASCIGSDMSIVGKIECKGPAQVFGRVEGELHASELLIGDGAQVEGSIIAQNVTVCGRVKGTIRAVRVKLGRFCASSSANLLAFVYGPPWAWINGYPVLTELHI